MPEHDGRAAKRYAAPYIGVVIDGARYENVNISASGILIRGLVPRAGAGEVVNFQLTYPKDLSLVNIDLQGRVVRADSDSWALEISPSTVAWQRLLDLHTPEQGRG